MQTLRGRYRAGFPRALPDGSVSMTGLPQGSDAHTIFLEKLVASLALPKQIEGRGSQRTDDLCELGARRISTHFWVMA